MKKKRIWERVNSLWFGDVDLSSEVVVPATEEEPEIIVLKQGEEPPKEEEEEKVEVPVAPVQVPDSSVAIAEGFTKLGEALKTTNQPQAPMPPSPVKDNFWDGEFKEKIFADETAASTFKEGVRRVVQEEVLPVVVQGMQSQLTSTKKLMKLDEKTGKYFTKYEKEIDEFVNNLAPNVRANPRVYEYALTQVMATHQEDIISEKVEEIVAQRLADRAPPDPGQVGEVSVPAASFSESGSAIAVGPKKKRKRIFLTSDDEAIMKRKGISKEDYVEFVKGGR